MVHRNFSYFSDRHSDLCRRAFPPVVCLEQYLTTGALVGEGVRLAFIPRLKARVFSRSPRDKELQSLAQANLVQTFGFTSVVTEFPLKDFGGSTQRIHILLIERTATITVMEAVVSHIRMDVAGGAEYMTALMVNLLHRAGFNVTLVTGTPVDRNKFSELSGIYIDDEVRIRTVSSAFDSLLTPTRKAGNALLTIYRSRLLKEVVTNLRPRVVLTDDEVFEALRGLRSFYGYLIHYVHFPYDNILNLYDLDAVRQRYEFPYKIALELYARWAKSHIILQNFSDMVIANSKYTRSHCEKIWSRDDVKVLYPSINTSAFRNSVSEKERTCIVIGRIAPDKNIQSALQAFRSPKLRDYKLVVAGQIIDQYERYAQTVIDASIKSPNIQVVPNPTKGRLKELLASAKVLLHPRRGEHFGLAIVEGMASGCIPVVHRSGGPMEIIDEGKYGFTFADKDDMADSILQAFESPPSRCAENIERARQFDTSVFEEGFTKVISSIA